MDLRRPDGRTPMKVLVKKMFHFVDDVWRTYIRSKITDFRLAVYLLCIIPSYPCSVLFLHCMYIYVCVVVFVTLSLSHPLHQYLHNLIVRLMMMTVIWMWMMRKIC